MRSMDPRTLWRLPPSPLGPEPNHAGIRGIGVKWVAVCSSDHPVYGSYNPNYPSPVRTVWVFLGWGGASHTKRVTRAWQVHCGLFGDGGARWEVGACVCAVVTLPCYGYYTLVSLVACGLCGDTSAPWQGGADECCPDLPPLRLLHPSPRSAMRGAVGILAPDGRVEYLCAICTLPRCSCYTGVCQVWCGAVWEGWAGMCSLDPHTATATPEARLS